MWFNLCSSVTDFCQFVCGIFLFYVTMHGLRLIHSHSVDKNPLTPSYDFTFSA